MSSNFVPSNLVDTDVLMTDVLFGDVMRYGSEMRTEGLSVPLHTEEAAGIMANGVQTFQAKVLLYEVRSAYNTTLNVSEGQAEYKIDRVFDQDTLTSYLEVILSENPCAPDCLAQVLVRFKEAIECGEEGIVRAVNTLADGIELMYLRTEVHRAALKLYTLSQLGFVRPQDEPMALLSPAIQRSLAEQGSEKETKSTRKRRRSA